MAMDILSPRYNKNIPTPRTPRNQAGGEVFRNSYDFFSALIHQVDLPSLIKNRTALTCYRCHTTVHAEYMVCDACGFERPEDLNCKGRPTRKI
jgi:hypothetical protein